MKMEDLPTRTPRDWGSPEPSELNGMCCEACTPKPMPKVKAATLIGEVVEIPYPATLIGDWGVRYVDRIWVDVQALAEHGELQGVVRSGVLTHSSGPINGDRIMFDPAIIERVVPSIPPAP